MNRKQAPLWLPWIVWVLGAVGAVVSTLTTGPTAEYIIIMWIGLAWADLARRVS